jgi:hypothetical protein
VPFEREQYELSVAADRYTLATGRASVEFMPDAARPVTVAASNAGSSARKSCRPLERTARTWLAGGHGLGVSTADTGSLERNHGP